MNATLVGLATFACTLGGALFGMWLRPRLPDGHLDADSRDTIKVGIGLIATMTALVLGLVTASAKSSFDTVDAAVRNAAQEILTVDRLLARCGPETEPVRAALQRAIAMRVDMIWPPKSGTPPNLDIASVVTQLEHVADNLRKIPARDEQHRALLAQAQEKAEALLGARWMMATGRGSSVAFPFLVILLFWLTITFASFGLFAPRNGTVLAVLIVCALSVGSALFLILEMDGPFDGVLQVSGDPLRYARDHLNQ